MKATKMLYTNSSRAYYCEKHIKQAVSLAKQITFLEYGVCDYDGDNECAICRSENKAKAGE